MSSKLKRSDEVLTDEQRKAKLSLAIRAFVIARRKSNKKDAQIVFELIGMIKKGVENGDY